MDKRTRTARDYGRAIEWLAAQAPTLAAPVAEYVTVLREECAALRTANTELRAAAGDPEALAAVPDAPRPVTVAVEVPLDILARAASLAAEQRRREERARTWLPTPPMEEPSTAGGRR